MAWLCHRWGFFSSEQVRVVFTPTSLCLSLPASLIRQACWGCSGVRLGGTGVRLPGLTAFVRDRHGLGVRRVSPESWTLASQRGVAWLPGGLLCPCAALCPAPSSTPLLAELSRQPCLEPRTSDHFPPQGRTLLTSTCGAPGAGQVGHPQGVPRPAAWLDSEVCPELPSSQRTGRDRGEPPDLGSLTGADNHRPVLPLPPNLQARVPGIPAALEAGARLWGSVACGSAAIHTLRSGAPLLGASGDLNHRRLFSVWSWRAKSRM